MSHSNVGGVKTKITSTTKTTTSSSSSSFSTQKQHLEHRQHQIQQKVISKPPHQKENDKENRISIKSTFDTSDKKQQNQNHDLPAPKMRSQQSRTEDVCVHCKKTVYKMEEVIAEHQVWHKNCFRCMECDKPLNRHSKVDSFQIHDGVVYCKVHFKQLFGTKTVDDASKRQRELAIHENQPTALPDGVILSSKRNDLGLEDIQTAAVKTRFQMFEKISTTKGAPEELQHNVGVKRSATVLSKIKKFHARGLDVGIIDVDDDNGDDDDSIHSEDYDDETDVDLIRAKRAQRERPSNFDNMAEIKNKFEAGMEQGREERHMERKQEIQNIRSRLFMGKQARTKEMYQNALAELETTKKLRNKGFSTANEMDNVKAAAKNSQNIKQRFETGAVYRKSHTDNDDEEFDEGPNQVKKLKDSLTPQISNKVSERMQMLAKQQANDQLIKSHAKVKGVEPADISNQYEFFENYNPEEHKTKGFGMTPPRTDEQNDMTNAKQIPSATKLDDTEAEKEISSKRPGYLDTDLQHAKQAARTGEIKDLFEKWNYENNVYIDSTAYNDTTPEYEEIDDSQIETTRTIRAKFENLPHAGRMQSTHHSKVNRFV